MATAQTIHIMHTQQSELLAFSLLSKNKSNEIVPTGFFPELPWDKVVQSFLLGCLLAPSAYLAFVM